MRIKRILQHGDSQYQSYGGPRSLEIPPDYTTTHPNSTIQNEEDKEEQVIRVIEIEPIEGSKSSEDKSNKHQSTSQVVHVSTRES